MKAIYTPRSSALILWALLLFFLPFFSSCTRHREPEADELLAKRETVTAKEMPPVTLAAIHDSADEVYFDLIANTSGCLGEDLWLGGKLETNSRITMASSGAQSSAREYTVTELTATGLNSNNSFFVNNPSGSLRAVCDANGVIHLQLNEGQLQLTTKNKLTPIVVAFQADQENETGEIAGSWSCR
ncbi:hypothetical protein CLV24_10382 [Pontibacter ummariensis]|uniref:Uncharacterized protein n=1 Tax=Pontibacter ummariensis TaxID=1610492 RepID=A0A239CT04_9BACT|nr:hypothetical protein [Pontibacter ummariensis]PRY14845.1 hypothetical protein CLV24_10382 [Pontibacter ummariensis]SNS23240.1 hypothetical protein SAMN06296052_103231 [Pontibacter ummariensis]